MGTKISAFTPVTAWFNADQLAGLQAGGDAIVTRDLFLRAQAGEAVEMSSAGGGQINLDSTGTILIWSVGGQAQFGLDSTHSYQVDALGNLSIIAAGSHTIICTTGYGGGWTCNNLGQFVVSCAAGQSAVIPYVPATPGDWVGPVPTTDKQAIDRISRALVVRTGPPIP